MGKRIEDLGVDDTPIIRTQPGEDLPITPPPEEKPPSPIDARDTGWYKFILDIEDLLATGQFNWAAETLEGIQRTVEETHRVTDGQKRAVDNIEKTKDRLRSGGSFYRRRYEGYR
jgi:hypothetical protein